MTGTDPTAPAVRGLAPSALITLGALTTLGPFSTDAFLPALPRMADELAAANGQVQLTLTGVTVGMALGQLFAGPLSDGVGRRRPLLVGSVAMAASAVGAALAPNLAVLVAWCVAMGLAASCGMVLSRAVVSDRVEGPALVSSYALLGTLTSIGPIASPIVGVVVLTLFGWRAIFVTLGLLAAACFVALAFAVPESLALGRRIPHPLRSLPRNTMTALRSPTYLGAATVIWFAFAAMFAYIAGSAFMVQSVLGLSPFAYSITFGVNGVGLILAGILTARLSGRMNAHDVIAIGLGMQGVAAVVILVTALTGTVSVWTLLPALFLIASSMGIIFGPATTISLHGLRHVAGTALAVIGSVQFVGAAIVSPLVEIDGPHNPVPFGVVIAVCVALGWASWAVFRPAARAAGFAR